MAASRIGDASGFSLLELIITMAVTLVIAGIASTLLASSLNVRERENQGANALADAERALATMSREIANSGFGLTNNGVIAGDSNASSIRIRANLNAYTGTASGNAVDRTNGPDEDVKYLLQTDAASGMGYIARLDINTGVASVVAGRIDSLRIHYYDAKLNYTMADCDISAPTATPVSPDVAKYVVLVACVQLPAVGTPGSPGYQPPTRVQLGSDVALRNTTLPAY